MACAHCGMACTSKGRDMSPRTFRMAIDSAEDNGCLVSLGGGEPTVHPRFWEFLGYALSKDHECGGLWLAPNGKRTADALALARLAKGGSVSVALSQDEWHEPIDPRVLNAFIVEDRKDNDCREIRTVKAERLIKAGRCKEGSDECICEDLVVEPTGRIRQCGCHDSPVLGHIRDGIKAEWLDNDGDSCWRKRGKAA